MSSPRALLHHDPYFEGTFFSPADRDELARLVRLDPKLWSRAELLDPRARNWAVSRS